MRAAHSVGNSLGGLQSQLQHAASWTHEFRVPAAPLFFHFIKCVTRGTCQLHNYVFSTDTWWVFWLPYINGSPQFLCEPEGNEKPQNPKSSCRLQDRLVATKSSRKKKSGDSGRVAPLNLNFWSESFLSFWETVINGPPNSTSFGKQPNREKALKRVLSYFTTNSTNLWNHSGAKI